jgi:hypothetical protein
MGQYTLLEAGHQLETDVRKGLFTPFLGVGTSTLRSADIDFDLYPWKEVALTLAAISYKLDERGRHFLQSLARHRLNVSSTENLRWIVPANDALRPLIAGDVDLGETLLVRFQVELVQATVHLTNYFGLRFSQEIPSIHRLEDTGVKFDLASEEEIGALARECVAHLLASADIALELQVADSRGDSVFLAKPRGVNRALERRRIYQKLMTLIVDLIGRSREAYISVLAPHTVGRHFPIAFRVEQGDTATFGILQLDAIQWLSDLLWYTVRYWIPFYPTTSELAFELSLAAKDAPSRRAELAQAAQALENESFGKANSLAEIIGNLVRYCEIVQDKEGADWQSKAFNYAIAAALQYQFEKYKVFKDLDGDSAVRRASLKDRFKAGDEDKGRRVPPKFPIPIAFTTNFDSSLEKAFEENDLGFHIVFPVLRGSRLEDPEIIVAPVWMVRTCYPRSMRRMVQELDWSTLCDANGVPRMVFVGPIIVKLYGSPTLELNDDKSEHWIVLSEVGYLEALEDRAKIPVWLTQQLASKEGSDDQWGFRRPVPRSIWFLGHSATDWNERRTLYEHCKDNVKLGGRRNTVDRSSDFYRTAILGALKVDQCLGDLNELPNMILVALEDDCERTTGNYENVRRLMDGVQKHLQRYQR